MHTLMKTSEHTVTLLYLSNFTKFFPQYFVLYSQYHLMLMKHLSYRFNLTLFLNYGWVFSGSFEIKIQIFKKYISFTYIKNGISLLAKKDAIDQRLFPLTEAKKNKVKGRSTKFVIYSSAAETKHHVERKELSSYPWPNFCSQIL